MRRMDRPWFSELKIFENWLLQVVHVQGRWNLFWTLLNKPGFHLHYFLEGCPAKKNHTGVP